MIIMDRFFLCVAVAGPWPWPGGRVAGWPGGRVAGVAGVAGAGWPGWPGGRGVAVAVGWSCGRVAGWPVAGRVAGWRPGGRVAGFPGGRVAVTVADSKPRRLAFRAFGGSYNFTGIRRASSV